MKRKEFMKRILTVTMAMSMVAVDVMPALASTTEVSELQEEMVEVGGTEVEAVGSVKGVSKVIGLDGSTSYHTMSSADGTVEKLYSYVYYEQPEQNTGSEDYMEDEDRDASYVYNLEGSGDKYYDEATGLYKYVVDGNTYYFASVNVWATEWDANGNPVAYRCDLRDRVQAFSKTLPQQDTTTGLFKMDGKYYDSYSKNYATDGSTVLTYYVRSYDRVYAGELYFYTSKKPVVDSVTGLYKAGDKYFSDYWNNTYDERTYYCYSGEIKNVLKTAPVVDQSSNFLLMDGEYYNDCGIIYRRGTGENVDYYTGTYSDYLQNPQNYANATILSYYLTQYSNYIVYPMDVTIPITLNSLGEVQNEMALVEKIDTAYGKKLATTDTYYSYYEVNGKYYKYRPSYKVIKTDNDTNGDGYKDGYVSLYAENGEEIVFNQKSHIITWQPVTNKTEAASNGKAIYVGYQVKEDGEQYSSRHNYKAENGQTFTTDRSYTSVNPYAAKEKAVYQVRAVYYTSTKAETKHSDGSKTVKNIYNIVKTGEWSDAYAYSYTTKEIPAVTGLQVTKESKKKYTLSWNAVADATSYTIQYMTSVHKISDVNALENMKQTDRNKLQASNWSTYATLSSNYITLTASALNWTVPVYEADGSIFKEYANGKYVYFRVRANVTASNWSDTYNKTNGAYGAAVVAAAPEEKANIPAMKGFAVEKNTDGSFRLKWNDVDDDAMIRIYYSTDANVFKSKEYLYELYNARAVQKCLESDGTISTYETYLSENAAVRDKMQIAANKVKYINVSGSSNENYISSYELDLEVGKKYYFVAVTYDNAQKNLDRTATAPLTINGVVYGKYTDISAPTKTVNATVNLEKPSVSTVSGKDSITLNMQGYSATGFEIYRKNAKGKFEKIATTTSAQYVDAGLAQNTTYTYQVKAYNYNVNTKKKINSEATVVTAETSINNYLTVKVTKEGKTSAKITWTKIAGAQKYEIYRSNTFSGDTNLSKKYDDGNWASAQSNAKWEYIKGIKEAGTTSYIDKNLTSGDNYSYKVIVYFTVNNGTKKVTKTLYDIDYVTLALEEPQNVKTTLTGTKAKVTWDADQYASQYQVKYKVYAANGRAYSNTWKSATVKKATYTIKGLKSGDSVNIRVRAYGNGKWTDYSTASDRVTLTAVKNVKAVTTNVKDANGKKTAAVKISWKSVSGAAYYRVYRSTSPAIYYNTDTKTYEVPEDAVLIAKASNTDETYNQIYYSDYKEYTGSVVGTSAIDRAQLQENVTYYYYVIACAANGEYQSAGCTEPAGIVGNATIPNIKKVAAKKGKITVTIQKTVGAKEYLVYRSTKKNSGFRLVGSTNKLSYVDKTVKKNTKYYYKIVVKGTNGLKADYTSRASKASKIIKAK